MKYFLVPTILIFLLTSCFKVDEDGDVFLTEDQGRDGLAIKFEFENLTSGPDYYFGANGEYSTTDDVTPFNTQSTWCLGRVDVYSNEGNMEFTARVDGEQRGMFDTQELDAQIYPGESLVIEASCFSCTLASGYFLVEIKNCDH